MMTMYYHSFMKQRKDINSHFAALFSDSMPFYIHKTELNHIITEFEYRFSKKQEFKLLGTGTFITDYL